MIVLDLTFPSPINMSCREGDTAYWSPVSPFGGFNVGDNITEIGIIKSIVDNGQNTIVTCYLNSQDNPPTAGSFVFFSKNNFAELTSLAGYYAEVTFKNNSSDPAELFATTCGITESSK